jgi:hypothetical protein
MKESKQDEKLDYIINNIHFNEKEVKQKSDNDSITKNQ